MMSRTLDVYLHEHLAGSLIQDKNGQLGFSYAASWLNAARAIPLSRSLPLRTKPFDRTECRGFFGGILPEQGKREVIARNLGISPKNDFAMLQLIGGECAGAITFVPAGTSLGKQEAAYREISNAELAEILKRLPERPLLAGEDGIRLSLAGAQDKIAVHVAGGKMSIPLGNAPSTHILKPGIANLAGVVFNEAFCMRLASALGLPTARVELGEVDGQDYLLVERYDRKVDLLASGTMSRIVRIHQEDFCQAMGVVSENKYQNEGGPSQKQCFQLIRQASNAPVLDLDSFLRAVIFNYLIGNHDAHGKNFSLFHHSAGQTQTLETRLAPLYDVLSTAFYPELSDKMAMKIGGEYQSSKIRLKHFDRFAEETGFAKPLVRAILRELAELILSKIPGVIGELPAAKKVSDLIQTRCQRSLKEFAS